MSKLQFRARTLDASKPMPIYLAEELPDLTDYSAINRAVPQMPSGMEKEEECEHHLQRAICTGLIIPTPEVTDMADAEAYDKIYPANYKQPRQLIHMQPFAMEQDIPDYDMDSEDEAWVEEQARRLDVTPLKFEAMMDRLEKSSGQTVVTLHDAKALLKEDDDLIIAIFDYWLNKRLKTQHPLILAVKTEHRMGSAANNPYLAFRRRTEKMQTRKNRKNDETSYEKMLKLRRDLSRAVTLLELVKRREKTKREHLHLTIEIAEKRYQAQDFNGALLAEVSALKAARPAFAPLFTNQFSNQNWVNKSGLKIDEIIPRKEKRQYKKRKHKTAAHCNRSMMAGPGLEPMLSSDEEDLTSAGTMLASPEEPETPDPDEGRYAFRRNKNCSYHMPITKEMGNWPWYSRNENGTADPRYRYTLTSISHPKPRCIGFARRRLGRGGRVILDRASTAYDDIWRNLDYTITDTPSLREKLACERLFKESVKKTCLQDDNEMSVDMRMLPPCSRTIETDVVESSPVQNVTPAGLRNLYTEHNYNLTSPSSCSGYMPQNYRLKDEADLSSDSLSGLGTSRRNLNQSFYNSVSVKSEPHNWTSGFVTDVQIKQEVDEQLVSERLNDCINKSDFASNSSVPAFENKIVRNSDETLVGVDSNCSQAVLEFLQEVKKDWLHFRPKTPPQGYEPPCHLLASEEEVFNPTNFTPIRIEIENLLSTPPSALVDTSTYTSEITLNDLYTDLNLDSQLLELSSDDMVCHSSFTLGLSSNTTLRDSRLEIDSNSDKDTDKIINDARSTSTKVASTLNEKLDFSGNDSQFGCSRVTFSSKENVESKKTTHGDRSPVEKISISGIYSTERCIISNSTSTASISTDSIRAKRYGMQHTTPQKKQTHTSISSSILSNTLTSPNKYNSVLNSSTAITPVLLDRVTNRSLTSGSVRITSIVNHHHLWTSGNDTPVHTNGPIAPVSRDETASSVTRRSNNKQLLHRSALDEDTNDEGAVLTETKLWSNTVYRLPNNSNANPQTRHLSLGTNTQTTHTLNSNSANNLESASPSLGDAIDSSTVRTKLPASSLQQQTSHFSNNMENNSAVTSTVPSGKQPNNKQQIMRKNNTLAMEVT